MNVLRVLTFMLCIYCFLSGVLNIISDTNGKKERITGLIITALSVCAFIFTRYAMI